MISGDTLAARLDSNLKSCADREFYVSSVETMSYGQLNRLMQQFHRYMEPFQCSATEVIILCCQNDALTTTLFLSLLRRGTTSLVLDKAATETEIERVLAYTDARYLFTDRILQTIPNGDGAVRVTLIPEDWHAWLDSLSDGNCDFPASLPADQTAVVIMTSGTTSEPKGVELTYENIVEQMRIFDEAYEFDGHSRLLNFLPIHHVDGLIRGPLAMSWAGGTLIRPDGYRLAEIQDIGGIIRRRSVSHLVVVPTILRWMLQVRDSLIHAFEEPTFKFIVSSADHLDEKLWREIQAAFGVKVINAYGLSELVCDALFAIHDHEVGTLGKPMFGELRIVDRERNDVEEGDAGELLFKGRLVMKGYLNRQEATFAVLKDGWLHTGDLVKQNSAGAFVFQGRKKNVVIRGGVTIQPEEITSAISGLDTVKEAVVLGVADELLGEKLVAFVCLREDIAQDARALLSELKDILSPEKLPSDIRFIDSLPRTASGKVLVESLRCETISSGASAEDIFERVKEQALACLGSATAELSRESSVYNTDGWDSLVHLSLITAIESHFGIEFLAEEILDFESLGDLERILLTRFTVPQ